MKPCNSEVGIKVSEKLDVTCFRRARISSSIRNFLPTCQNVQFIAENRDRNNRMTPKLLYL